MEGGRRQAGAQQGRSGVSKDFGEAEGQAQREEMQVVQSPGTAEGKKKGILQIHQGKRDT